MERLGALIEAHLEGRPSWVALLGPRKIGKTSLLRHLQKQAAATESAVVVTLDLFAVDAKVQEVFTALIGALLAGACEGSGHLELAGRLRTRPPPYTGDLAHALSIALPFDCVGRTLALLEALQRPQVSNAELTEVLGLPEAFAQELGKSLWVILDEVQELEALNRQKPFSKRHTIFRLMRSVWQEHSQVSYWVTGSQVSMLRALLTDRRSPFHGHFQLQPLGPFELDVAAELLIEGTTKTRRGKDAPAAAALVAKTLGGHPFYMQVLGEELELRRVPLTERSVKAVLQEVLLSPTGRLSLHLQGVLEADAGSGQQLGVLRALARGEASLAELVKQNPTLSRESTHVMLRRLEGADLVLRDEATHRFRVADPALASYLRVGGLEAEPSPAVLGDEGEQAAARHLLAQGLRPVYQSYRSLGPADLVVLEPGRRLALQVKRSPLPIYIKETDYQRLALWAKEQSMEPVLCQVEPEEPTTVHYLRWSESTKTGRRRRFDESSAAASVLSLLDELSP